MKAVMAQALRKKFLKTKAAKEKAKKASLAFTPTKTNEPDSADMNR